LRPSAGKNDEGEGALVNLHKMLLERQAQGRPVTVGLVGAGKFGTMFLAQARTTDGLHVVAVADLNVARARSQLKTASWPEEQSSASSLADAAKTGRTFLTDDAEAMIAHPAIEVIVEATGDPKTGIRLATAAIRNGKHIVMVNVEADALAGRSSPGAPRRRASSTRSPGATSPPSCASTSTGRAPAASR
jgi:predicted homoserine dehydrogenase-like protein